MRFCIKLYQYGMINFPLYAHVRYKFILPLSFFQSRFGDNPIIKGPPIYITNPKYTVNPTIPMDIKTHFIFSEKLLEICGLDGDYKIWGIAPDMVEKYHRWRHKFSKIRWIYKRFGEKHEPCKDRKAISLCVISHLYLDMFNGVLPAFIFPPYITLNIPVEEIRELVKDLNYLSFSTPEEFYEEERTIFEDLNEGEACEYISVMIISLADHTYLWRPNVKRRALKYLEGFIEERIEIRRDLVEEVREFTERYKKLVIKWCEKI